MVDYPVLRYEHAAHSQEKGEYRHFMLKEIHEQPAAIANTLEGTLSEDHVLTAILGLEAETRLKDLQNIHIVACGTSCHAGLVARYWIEDQAGLPCQVEVASEYRYCIPGPRAHRGGQLITFACERVEMDEGEGVTHLTLPWVYEGVSPIVYTVPLQLLSYHVALVKGTDVDKPRNLAKSVTVE